MNKTTKSSRSGIIVVVYLWKLCEHVVTVVKLMCHFFDKLTLEVLVMITAGLSIIITNEFFFRIIKKKVLFQQLHIHLLLKFRNWTPASEFMMIFWQENEVFFTSRPKTGLSNWINYFDSLEKWRLFSLKLKSPFLGQNSLYASQNGLQTSRKKKKNKSKDTILTFLHLS